MLLKFNFSRVTETPQKPASSLSLRVFCCLLSAGLLRFYPENLGIRLGILCHYA
ncbi:hypothetical protein Dda3937_01231 [Dickeya dadantii 3937]|uniref:Uncharacterized protein n=1 Tax=Dickeya dadantii (strain 3937) TaxID=198628 RepID=E0SL81_DICD3|nr:hypothetical protein Dda3937_01231 [Dickeya dadantii 3937]